MNISIFVLLEKKHIKKHFRFSVRQDFLVVSWYIASNSLFVHLGTASQISLSPAKMF